METSSTPKPIKALRSDVVDQIAAGEVVERPAHLVKELIENAFDAGASQIDVEFDQGGRWVRVTDNGVGIRPSDLSQALSRHTTSKIDSADDLWRLSSYGFRGEALASIGAVSALEIQSRPENEQEAHRVKAEFGKLTPIEPSGGNLGTMVTVERLFENVPARLKFMKSEVAEGAQIRNVVKAAALARPEVGVKLRSRGKTEFVFSSGETFLSRAESVTGVKMYSVTGEYEGIKAEIAFSGPQDVLGNSKGFWFFVQDRWIQDRSLAAAVVESYRGLLMHGEFPYAVVKLTAPEGEVDVNIHPTKSAVKFRDPARAFRAISRVLRPALERGPWMASGDPHEATPASRASAKAEGATPYVPLPIQNSVADYTRAYQPLQVKQKIDFTPAAPANTKPKVGAWSRLQVLGQAAQTYIICEDGDRLIFVDQHAAHERVAFERLMRAWTQKVESAEGLERQQLLIPLLIEIEPESCEALIKHRGELARIGLDIDLFGPRTIAVQSLPTFMKESVVEKGLRDLALAVLENGSGHAIERAVVDIFATMACHSVVRAGQALSFDQMRGLLEQMDEFPLSSFCPHGRPVSVEYPLAQLERDFGRTV